jgi:hypothetical protein
VILDAGGELGELGELGEVCAREAQMKLIGVSGRSSDEGRK